jgi:hypothetical protein
MVFIRFFMWYEMSMRKRWFLSSLRVLLLVVIPVCPRSRNISVHEVQSGSILWPAKLGS